MANSKKTTKPSGLKIERSGNSFKITWKIGDSNYELGQQLFYSVEYANNKGFIIPSKVYTLGKKVTTYTVTLTATNVLGVYVNIRGRKGKFKTSKMVDGKKKQITVTPDWSAWASEKWTTKAPTKPTLTYTYNGTNRGTFAWSTPTSATDRAIVTRVEAQTCIVRGLAAPSAAQWGSVITKNAAGSQVITEETEAISAGNFVRWYRVRAVGPAGTTAWATATHTYGYPTAPVIKSASGVVRGTATRLTVTWNDAYNNLRPIDKLTLQYAIGVPRDVAMTAPASGWSNAKEVFPNGRDNTVVTDIEEVLAVDEVLWVRVKADHDGNESYSAGRVAQVQVLGTPTLDAVPNTTNGNVAITITEQTQCEAACTVIFFRSEKAPSVDRIVAIFPHGTTQRTINVPDIVGARTTCFGAYALLGTYSGLIVTARRMSSPIVIDSDIGAVAPRTVVVSAGPRDGTVRIGWEWTWTVATQAELSWSEYEDAWESTDAPKTYIVEDRFANNWIISGLELGKRWYFRVRLKQVDEDNDVTGPWSTIQYFDLTSAPDRPALTLSKSVINAGESVTARWGYSSPDGTKQAYAEICRVTYSGGNPVYGAVVAHVDVGQSVVIRQTWTTGAFYYFAVRTTSTSGIQSVWSEPASLYIAPPVSVAIAANTVEFDVGVATIEYTKVVDPDTGEERWEITGGQGGIRNPSATTENFNRYKDGAVVVIEETATTKTEEQYTVASTPYLEYMPIEVTVTGAGATGTTILSIVRAEDYRIARPDDTEFDGYEGETIATHTQTGEAPFTITVPSLVGKLDDGAEYIMIATVIDEYGQTASTEVRFAVRWYHKAGVPGVSAVTDDHQRIVQITPIAPENYLEGDTCDIYRLTTDKPELIIKSGNFGTAYVDPYPGFGDACGHRVVTITANGDYAGMGEIAWYDSGIDDGDYLDDDQLVIDVDGQQIALPYNLSISNTWKKDFKRTTYLGGSVQGDWNPAVTRDMTANTVIVRGADLDQQIAMRNLAGYAGVAHVRTPDGSSITANIQINESQSYDKQEVSYTLTIQAIDPEEPDGMTLEDWQASHPVGE